MRIRQISLEIDAGDINSIFADFLPDVPLRVTSIDQEGIKGQIHVLWWNIDFVAMPYSLTSDELNIDISARKLVSIPTSIIERQLREAMKDAPPGIDVRQQMLRVRFTPLLAPIGLSLQVEHVQPCNGYVQITLAGVGAKNVALWFQGESRREATAALEGPLASEYSAEL